MGGFRIPGPLGTWLQPGGSSLLSPSILNNPQLQPLKDKATSVWDRVVELVDPAELKKMLKDIYDSRRWADANKEDKEGNLTDPKNARLPNTLRERDARRPTDTPTMRLKDPKVSIENGILNGTASFVLELPSPYSTTLDSPTLIKVQIKSPKVDQQRLSLDGRATAMGKLVRMNFNVQLHYDPRELVKALAALARDKQITQKELEQLLSKIRLDLSAFGWVTILPTWAWVSSSSLLPLKRPLLGAMDRLLPAELAALPDSSLLNVGTIAIPAGVFFDVPAPAAGIHWSRFGRSTGFALTGGVVVTPNIAQIGKNWGKAASVYGYADLYYVKRVSKTVDLGFGLTYAIDAFGERAEPSEAHLHYLEANHQPWLPSSRENVAPSDDRSGQRLMFMLKGTHDAL
ncbi:MAG: hypothetical protein HY718_07810 [Planctomycetes bacterium]|nr:hypothetical protein [Planctomycetota bacterium]